MNLLLFDHKPLAIMAFQLLESSKNKENSDHICKLLAKSLWYRHDRGLHKCAILSLVSVITLDMVFKILGKLWYVSCKWR